MNIQNKLAKIIPPDDYQHRHEFSNHQLIDELNNHEKKEIENLLLNKLHASPEDILIIETLSYLRSENAVPAMISSLKNCKNSLQKIIIAISIYKINHENGMIDAAIDAFKQLYKKWDLVFVFSYLKEFNDKRINEMIKRYIDNPDFLISHNAKRALGLTED
jgi:hypothetical protein